MNNGFLSWVSLSVSGTILALAILALSPWFRGRISYSWQYGIWIMVILRLLLPAAPGLNGMTALVNSASAVWQTVVPEKNEQPALPYLPAQGPAAPVLSGADGETTDTGGEAIPGAEQSASISAADRSKAATPAGSTDWSMLTGILQACWIAGAAGMSAWKIRSYLRFRRLVMQNSRLETDPVVTASLNQCRTELGIPASIPVYRSPLIFTPVLMGLRRPAVLLPEGAIDSRELRYMLLHELTHYRRQDLPVKWLVQLAVCLHWFNPAVYWIARRMDRLCELACDESVIRRMSPADKQGYGKTLIALAASPSPQPSAMLGTMSREGHELKERLVSIMKSGVRKNSARLGLLLLAAAAAGAFFIGYLRQPETNTYRYGFAQFSIHHVQLGERFADLDMSQFQEADEAKKQSLSGKYQFVSEQIMLNIRSDGRITGIHGNVYEDGFAMPYFTMEGAEISAGRVLNTISQVADLLGNTRRSWYDRGQQLKAARYEDKDNGIAITFVYSATDDRLVWVLGGYTSDPPPAGIRSLYPLERIAAYKTPYIGDASKVSQIAGRLPGPHRNFTQRFMALQTSQVPYGLTLYYEAAAPLSGVPVDNPGIPLDDPAARFGKVMRSNALVLFSMIGNLDQVTYSFRPDMSGRELDQSAYPVSYTFRRADFARYGDLSALSADLGKLEEVLLKGLENPVTGLEGLSENQIDELKPVVRQLFFAYLESETLPSVSSEKRIKAFKLDQDIQAFKNDSGIYFVVMYDTLAATENFVIAGGGEKGEDGWLRNRSLFVSLEKDGAGYKIGRLSSGP